MPSSFLFILTVAFTLTGYRQKRTVSVLGEERNPLYSSGNASSFFVLVHQDAGVGPGDGWLSTGLSMDAQNSPATNSGQPQKDKGQTQNLQSYCAAQSNASEMPLYGREKSNCQ